MPNATKPRKQTGGHVVKAALSAAKIAAARKVERDKKRANSLLALIARRIQRIAEDFYDIGEALRELRDKNLFSVLGYHSFNELLDAKRVMSRVQAFKLIKLVETIPRDEALQLGQEKAYALVAYTVATPEDDVPAELVKADAELGDKPLSKMSVKEVRNITKAVRKKTGVAVTRPKAKERQKEAGRLEKSTRAILRKAGISRAVIEVRGDDIIIRINAV